MLILLNDDFVRLSKVCLHLRYNEHDVKGFLLLGNRFCRVPQVCFALLAQLKTQGIDSIYFIRNLGEDGDSYLLLQRWTEVL